MNPKKIAGINFADYNVSRSLKKLKLNHNEGACDIPLRTISNRQNIYSNVAIITQQCQCICHIKQQPPAMV